MTSLAIIGGTGLYALQDLEITEREMVRTPYGEPSGPLTHGVLGGKNVVFLARHGYGHTIPPHNVNYRANMWAFKEAGVERVIAVNAVGGIRTDMAPGRLAFPDQLIDYTWSRVCTFQDEWMSDIKHIDFTHPYCEPLRHALLAAVRTCGIDAAEDGTYGCTQGPRLETAAEIDRLERDGCDIVGMTSMPEAALAKELDICYASCCVVANHAAGRGAGEITMKEIEQHLSTGMEQVRHMLECVIPTL